ncbi:MAG: dephospho-CoA kinase [Burkholderiaceae bacterium]
MGYVVGLTGGIGSGKSEVGNAFVDMGADLADADIAAHAVTAPGEAGHAAVRDAFGPRAVAVDGMLDRQWLREAVFADPLQRRQLEGLLHPLIHANLRARMARWNGPYGILSVPLLLERGTLLPLIARVLVVDCPVEIQVQRVMARSALSADAVRTIMATQLPRAARLAQADDVIDNTGTLVALHAQVRILDGKYRIAARAHQTLVPARSSPENG